LSKGLEEVGVCPTPEAPTRSGPFDKLRGRWPGCADPFRAFGRLRERSRAYGDDHVSSRFALGAGSRVS